MSASDLVGLADDIQLAKDAATALMIATGSMPAGLHNDVLRLSIGGAL